jgi:hypothetical protein
MQVVLETSPSQVLLIRKGLVAGNKYVKTALFGGF